MVVIQKAGDNYAACVPDMDGVAATGDSVQQTLHNLQEAVEMHLEAMAADHEAAPDPQTLVDYIEVHIPLSVK